MFLSSAAGAISFNFVPLFTQIIWLAFIVFFVLLLIRLWNYTKTRLTNDREIIRLLRDIQARLDASKQRGDSDQ